MQSKQLEGETEVAGGRWWNRRGKNKEKILINVAYRLGRIGDWLRTLQL